MNGVYRDVLEEIRQAQSKNTSLICYLQPYSASRIVLFAEDPPSTGAPGRLYFSTTQDLGTVSYTADAVGWEDKLKLSESRLAELNKHIKEHQPGEDCIYPEVDGKKCVNLLAVMNMRELQHPYASSNLVKVSDELPLKKRTQAGGWSPVQEPPDWLGISETYTAVQHESKLQREVRKSLALDQQARLERLNLAKAIPVRISLLSVGFRRNQDVIAEVLLRANGICEQCKKPAPFRRASDNSPYLEVHHIKTLADGGEDTVSNAKALCPNCHREAHFGVKKV